MLKTITSEDQMRFFNFVIIAKLNKLNIDQSIVTHHGVHLVMGDMVRRRFLDNAWQVQS